MILALQQKTNMIQHGREEIHFIWCVPPSGTTTNDHEKLEKSKVPEKEPAEVDVREATTADDIFTKLRSEISNAIPTTINSKGRNGAPPQSIKTVEINMCIQIHIHVS